MPLYLNEPASEAAQQALEQDGGQLVTSAVSIVEIRSGLARLEREGVLSPAQVDAIFERIRSDLDGTPRRLELSQEVIEEALRLLKSRGYSYQDLGCPACCHLLALRNEWLRH